MADRFHRERESAHGAEGHRRDAHYEQFCADLVREAVDAATLERAWARVQHAREVRADATLEAKLRAFVEQKKTEILEHARLHARALQAKSAPGPVQPSARPAAPKLSADQLRVAVVRAQAEFSDAMHQFDAPTAGRALHQIREWAANYGGAAADAATLERLKHELAELHDRLAHFGAHIERLEQHALIAARDGRFDVVARLLGRLSSIRATRPHLLSEGRLAEIRESLVRAGEMEERRAAAKELIERERAVAGELRRIALAIHEFHRVIREPHSDEQFHAAEVAYRRAVLAIKSHDREWLAGLILELEGLIEILHDPFGRATAQLDRFLASVRKVLREAIHEAREIQAERSHPSEDQPHSG